MKADLSTAKIYLRLSDDRRWEATITVERTDSIGSLYVVGDGQTRLEAITHAWGALEAGLGLKGSYT